jgi:hypothetical protein
MSRSIYLLMALAVLALGLVGCSETPRTPSAPLPDSGRSVIQGDGIPCGEVHVATFFAGQSIDVGTVTVYNDQDMLYMEIQTTGRWVLTETHVAVAPTLDGIPQTGSGNPKVGQFLLSAIHNPPITNFVHRISLTEYGYVPGQTLFIAVHAKVSRLDAGGHVVQRETAWADGLDFPGANWATYLNYVVQTCDDGGEGEHGGGE